MADVLKEPEYMAATYTPQNMPAYATNMFINSDGIAPPPTSSSTVRPTKGQGFPIGGQR